MDGYVPAEASELGFSTPRSRMSALLGHPRHPDMTAGTRHEQQFLLHLHVNDGETPISKDN